VKSQTPDLIIYNAEIITLDPALPKAQALAVCGERIISLGDDRTIRRLASDKTYMIDARGLTIIPGFNDNHIHAVGMGFFYLHPNLLGKTAEEIVAALKKHYRDCKPGEPILGFAWDYSSCPRPSKAILDAAFPRNPVMLRQYSGHAVWLNSLALDKILRRKKRKPSSSGEILRDEAGEPTGIIRGTIGLGSHKKDLLLRVLNFSFHRKLVCDALERFSRVGITSVQDNTWQPVTVFLLARLKAQGRLTARFSCWPFGQYRLLARLMDYGPYDRLWIRKGPLKYIVDGAFSPHTAWMLEPYQNEPGNYGRPIFSPERLAALVKRQAGRGKQLAFHAIGDRAVREVINAVEKTAEEIPAVKQLRIRLEHAQIIHPDDLARLKRLGMLVAAQPTALALPDRDYELLGEKRFQSVYPYRSLINAGVGLSFGSDIPGEIEYNPFQAIYRAVSRRGLPGSKRSYNGAESVSAYEAVTAYTKGSAYAEFMENEKGTLSPGMLADFIVLSDNILCTDPARIPLSKVLLTVVGGKIVFSAL
jgi:predicted amidohydrolase YtcJ